MAQPTEGFEAILDVSGFSPDEITVQTDERFLLISGQHEEWLPDQGYVMRHFIRRYLLPDNVETSGLSSQLHPDGKLLVRAPAKESSPPAVTDKG